ncbi:MAG: SIMPL domain-containing protein [Halanaerobiales bacterium]|nr:SIMPL domain-containing protein [Halanaerobiales bacterium]
MKNNKKYALLMFLLISFMIFSQAVNVGAQAQTTEVNINHRIEESFKPEIANINIEVWSQKEDLETAYSNTTNRMNSTIEALNEFEDLTYTTTTFSVNQRFIEENKKRVKYYEVSTMIKIETENLKKLGNIIERVVAVGGTNIKGISYGLKSPEKAKNKVIQKGIEEIKDKANIIKESLDKVSYRIVKLDVNDNYSIYNYNYNMMRSDIMSAQESLPVPNISPQDVNINVNFSVKIELK